MTGRPSSAVSVLVPTYNRAAYIVECLESLLGQTVPPAQVVVINDGSTDDTAARLAPFRDRILYLEQANAGKSAALNLGMDHVTGDYVWIFDDDDVALPDAIERHMQTFAANPGIGFTYSTYLRGASGPDGRIVPGDDVKAPRVDDDRLFVRLLESNFIPHPAAIVRADCMRSIGPSDPALVRSQDYDLFLRLARTCGAAMVAGPTYCRRYHSGQRGSSADAFAESRYEEKGLQYEKIIFRRLFRELQLSEYLPRGSKAEGSLKRLALLQRAAVMGRRGLWSEAIPDLAAAAEQDSFGPLVAAERELLWQVAANPAALLELGRGALLLADLRKLRRTPTGNQMLRSLAKSMLNTARTADGVLSGKVPLSVVGLRVLGVHGIARELANV